MVCDQRAEMIAKIRVWRVYWPGNVLPEYQKGMWVHWLSIFMSQEPDSSFLWSDYMDYFIVLL